MSIRRDTLRSLFFQLLAVFAGLVTNIVVARRLGPEGKGVISFLGYVLAVATTLGGLGLQSAAIQHLGKKRFPPAVVAGSQIMLSIPMGVLCALLVALVIPAFSHRMEIPAGFLPPFLIVLVLALLQLELSGVIVGLGRIRLYNWVSILTPLAWTSGAVVIVWLFHGGLKAALWTWMAAQMLGGITSLVWVLVRVRPTVENTRACARDSLRFGFVAYAAGLIWTLLLRSDAMMLGYLAGPGPVGIYSVSVLFGELLWHLPRSLSLAMSPQIAGLPRAEAAALTRRAARLGFWSVIVASVFLVLLAPLVLRFAFGRSFAGSMRPLLLLIPGIVAGALSSAPSLYFVQQLGRPRINIVTSAAGLGLNFALNLFLIPRYGPSGAAVSSSVAYTLVTVLLVLRFRSEPGFSWRRLLLPERRDFVSVLDGVRLFLRGSAA